MITISPQLLVHPAEVRALASELLDLRFDRARLTEALLAMQEQAEAVEATDRAELELSTANEIRWWRQRRREAEAN